MQASAESIAPMEPAATTRLGCDSETLDAHGRKTGRRWLYVASTLSLIAAGMLSISIAKPDLSIWRSSAIALGGLAISFVAIQWMLTRLVLYEDSGVLGSKLSAVQATTAAALGVMLISLFGDHHWLYAIILFFSMACALLIASRWAQAAISLPRSLFPLRPVNVVILGATGASASMSSYLSEFDRYCHITSCVTIDAPSSKDQHGAGKDSPTAKNVRELLFREAVDIVIAVGPIGDRALLAEVAQASLDLGLRFALFENQCDNLATLGRSVWMESADFLGVPLQIYSTISFSRTYLLSKRLIDIVVSLLALLCLSPILALIAVLIKISSPRGPIFFQLLQVGLNRRPIVCYKFRSMVPDADRLKWELKSCNEMDGPVFKMRNDPRITPIGRILRRYSFDELPQLWSVLKGDLSLVGPRAPLRTEVDDFQFWQRRKLAVKPGLTCFWQINGRSEIADFSEWVRLDLQYIHVASLWTDLTILLRTFPVVFFGRGAY